jgi:hypothetical protein
MEAKHILSIVIPAYNEYHNLELLIEPKSRSWGITEIGQPANFLG